MKNINFIPFTEKAKYVIDPPVPAKTKIPEWFKKIPLKIFEQEELRLPSGWVNLSIKSCPAVVDMMTMGYMICLDSDVVFVDPDKYGYRVVWDVSWNVVTEHSTQQISEELVPPGFEKTPLKWERYSGWSIKTPPGYSLLYFHPFYRNDLPFLTLPGIVDADLFDSPTNLPFFVKEGFYGVLEKGTPIAQVIPIKREPWSHKIDKNVMKNSEHKNDILKSVVYRSYKKRWWQKKNYK